MLRRCLVLVLISCGGADTPPPPEVDAPAGPFDLPPQCTSGARWKLGDQRSPLMYPGRACNACHESRIDTPRFSIAGTVYPTGHEPDNCNGAIGATVEVTDAAGTVFSMVSNDAGNFMLPLSDNPVFPIHARVIVGDTMRAMAGAVPTGDCNGCHTQDGTSSAPGRVVLP